MRGRSIISGSKEVLALKNNQNVASSPVMVDAAGSAPVTTGTDNDQSTRRILNDNNERDETAG